MRSLVLAVLTAASLGYACGGDDGGSAGTGGSVGSGGDAASGGSIAAAGGDATAGSDTLGGTTGEPGPGEYQPDYQTSDGFFTRMSTPANSGSVHGTVRIWYSANIMDFPVDGPFTVPEGTVAIKEEYDASNTVFVKVVMIKQAAGYDPANNDWYYEARNPDDTLAADPVPGTPSLCINCHQQSAATDFLQGFSIAN